MKPRRAVSLRQLSFLFCFVNDLVAVELIKLKRYRTDHKCVAASYQPFFYMFVPCPDVCPVPTLASLQGQPCWT